MLNRDNSQTIASQNKKDLIERLNKLVKAGCVAQWSKDQQGRINGYSLTFPTRKQYADFTIDGNTVIVTLQSFTFARKMEYQRFSIHAIREAGFSCFNIQKYITNKAA